jgi:guanine deaminase
MERELQFMKQALQLAEVGMLNDEGGPFGCVIIKNDLIVGHGNNRVLITNDPTAHAEIVAIRDACSKLNSFQLEDCEIYTSCEPCPMCMGAIYWARPKIVYYACTRYDAAAANFDDSFIYEELKLPAELRKIRMECLGRNEGTSLFAKWNIKPDKKLY